MHKRKSKVGQDRHVVVRGPGKFPEDFLGNSRVLDMSQYTNSGIHHQTLRVFNRRINGLPQGTKS